MSEKEQDDRYAPAPMLKNQDDPFFGPVLSHAHDARASVGMIFERRASPGHRRSAPRPRLERPAHPGSIKPPASGSNPRRRVTGPPPPATASKRAGAVFKRGASAFKRA